MLTLIVADPKNPTAFKFPFPDFYLDKWSSILCAIFGFIIFIQMVRLSMPSQDFHIKRLGYATWKATTYKPLLPPLSLIVALVIVTLIFLKIVHLVTQKRLFCDK